MFFSKNRKATAKKQENCEIEATKQGLNRRKETLKKVREALDSLTPEDGTIALAPLRIKRG